MISWSQAQTYRQCARKWGYRYVDGLVEPSNKYLEHGKKIHSEIESYFKTGAPENDVTVAADKIFNLYSGETVADYVEYGVSDENVRGFIDVLVEAEDSHIVIDWKTSARKPSRQKIDSHWRQLSLYAFLVGAVQARLVVGYPEYGIHVERDYDRLEGEQVYSSIVETKRELDVLKEHVSLAEELPASPSMLCRYCGFRDICPDSYDKRKKELSK